MIDRARLRMLADYLAATRNEIAVDEMFLGLAGVSAVNVGHWPRVPHWLGFAKRYPYLTSIACRLTLIVWLSGGAMLFFLREYLIFSHLRRSFSSVALTSTGGVILALSTRVCDVIKSRQFPALPRTWFTIPWVPQKELPEGAQELRMLSILNELDFRFAFADAITVTYRIRRNRHLSPWILQGYTAFRWFLVRRAIDRLTGELVMTEHFDRWAVLADRSIREKRRISNCNDRLIIVQHGSLDATYHELNYDMPSIKLPTYLSQVDELYAYNRYEAAIFQSDVFVGRKNTHALDLNFFQPVIELTGEKTSNMIRILFVGHPLCEPFQAAVFRELTSIGGFEIFYKPHPKAPMSSAMISVGWKIVTDENIFPLVDFLISYHSTLVVEYKRFDISAFVHPLNAEIDSIFVFVENIRNLIGVATA